MRIAFTLILTLAFFTTRLHAQIFCDDFNSGAPWANLTSVSTPGLIGNTQNNSQAVTLLNGGVDFNSHSGMYGTGDVNFNFTGNNQQVDCQVFYMNGQENQFEISVNGSAFAPISDFFTSSMLSGVQVSLDSTMANTSFSGFNDALLAFDGMINSITIRFFESGINELCTDEPWPTQPFFECDNFENDPAWANLAMINTPGIIGQTQNNTQPVTLLSGFVEFNSFSGMYGAGDVNFDFNGNNQQVSCQVFYLNGQESQFEISVNGSAFAPISNFFISSTLSGVQISLDSTLANTSSPGFNDAMLTFDGMIDSITFRFFESGINELCIDQLSQPSGCDDFQNDPAWANTGMISTPGIIGHTQNNTQAVTLLSGFVEFNSHPGIYGAGDVNFAFNGNDQQVNCQVYYLNGQENQFEISVNGSAFAPISNFFTSSMLSGVQISLDSTLTNTSSPGFNDAMLNFDGVIDSIIFRFFESGINELCIDESSETYGCDDFENDVAWDNLTTISTPGIIGYTQNNTQAVTLLSGYLEFNSFSGMYGVTGGVNFDFDGSNQQVTCQVYYINEQENQFEISVNGSAFAPISNFYTSSILSGVQVSLDSTLANTSSPVFNDALLTFTGTIDSITIQFFESGINELCIDGNTANIVENKELEFSLYPNPASHQITLSEVSFDYLVISDNFGRTVKTQNYLEGKMIDLSDFPNGIYHLNIVSENNSGKKRFVVVK